jgi:hypothetical protein
MSFNYCPGGLLIEANKTAIIAGTNSFEGITGNIITTRLLVCPMGN